jgi:hypothetical protein
VGLHAHSAFGGLDIDTAAVAVPAGDWIVFAQDSGTPNASTTVTCRIFVNGTDAGHAAENGPAGAITSVTAFAAAITTGSNTAIQAVCDAGVVSFNSSGALVVAIPVAALN